MNDRLAILLALPLLAGTLAALFTVLGALFSEIVQRTQAAAGRMPWRATLLGLVNALFVAILAAAFSSVGEDGVLGLLAVLLLALLSIGLAFGLAAMATLIGERLLPEASRTRQTVWGAVAMLLASLTPFLGWFVLFPYLALRGLGALVIQAFNR